VTRYQRHSATSREAADLVRRAPTLRQQVLRAIVASGRRGMTDEELQEELHINPSTQRPRRIELVDAGLVVDSGQTRPTRSGRQAVVWFAVALGEQLELL